MDTAWNWMPSDITVVVIMAASVVTVLLALAMLLSLDALRRVNNRRQAETVTQALTAVKMAAVTGQSTPVRVDGSAHVLAVIAASLRVLEALRGEAHDSVVHQVQASGYVDEARMMLTSRSAVHRAVAVEFLGALGRPWLVPELTALLTDPAMEVRHCAVKALAGTAGPETVPALLAVLTSDRPVSEVLVAESLVRMGQDIGPTLVESLHSSEHRQRSCAVRVLGLLNFAPAVDALQERVDADPDEDVRVAALHALGRLGNPASASVVAQAAQPGSAAAVRIAALSELAGFANSSTPATLERYLEEDDPAVVRATAYALAACGEPGQIVLACHVDGEEIGYCDEALASRHPTLNPWSSAASRRR